MTTLTWSPQQDEALTRVAEWMESRDKPFFYLAGFAGTGKTTLAREFAAGVDGHVAFASFTGKAASVMREKGCPGATTIHRLIYTPAAKGAGELRKLRNELAEIEDKSSREAIQIRLKIQAEVLKLKAPNFDLNEQARLRDAALVVIDECSMVDERMGQDLLSFGVPVLVLGDPAQLPPVFGRGYFTDNDPDFMLTEVHRQARESGILRLATEVRQGRGIDYCDYGDARVIRRDQLDPQEVLGFDQIITATNKKRHGTNRRVRELLGRTSDLPETGDRLLCLRNNHDLALLNGEIYYATAETRDFGDTCSIRVRSDGVEQWLDAWTAPFRGEALEHFDNSRDTQEFGYGYTLTCHKAQGSQFDSVLVFDGSGFFRDDAARWLYTAVTRAAKNLTVVR